MTAKGCYDDDPDVQRMLAFQKGDKAAFEALLKAYFPRILNFIHRFVRDRQQAEDLTQDVFIKVYHASDRYRPEARFRTWLYTIARRTSLNAIRRNKIAAALSLDALRSSEKGDMPVQVEDKAAERPDEGLLRHERTARVRRAIEALPLNQREAVILRRYEELSYEEIAQTMGISLSAVKSLLNRAKENLKEALRHEI